MPWVISNKSKCQNPVVLNRFGLYWFINAKSHRTNPSSISMYCSVIVQHLNLGVLSIAFFRQSLENKKRIFDEVLLIVHCIHCWCLPCHHHQGFNRSSHPEINGSLKYSNSRSKSVMKIGSFPLSQPLVGSEWWSDKCQMAPGWFPGWGSSFGVETFPSSKHPLIIIIFRTCADPLSAATSVSTSLFINTLGGTLKSRKYQF